MLEDDQAIADELEYYELEYKIQTLIEGFRRQEQLKLEGEMDLRIRTSDFGHNVTPLSHLVEPFKAEPPASPTSAFSNTSPASSTSSMGCSVKQEVLPCINNNTQAAPQPTQVANFLIKTELPDPHFNDSQIHFDKQTSNFKNCVALPISLTPTPTEDTSEKLIVGSTSQFLPDSSNKNLFECVIYVKGDTSMLQRVEFFLDYETTDKQLLFGDKPVVRTCAPFEIRQKFVSFQQIKILLFFKSIKGNHIDPVELVLPVHVDSAKSGIVRQGIETQVEYPADVAIDQRKISELATWLQAPPMKTRLGDVNAAQGNKIVYQTDFSQSSQAAGGLLKSTTQGWTKSAPTSPLSPGSPNDNRIIRSASSSPIRQTVLPNPCIRQKPFNRSASVGSHSEPILASTTTTNRARGHLVDGEPMAKRRPGPVTPIATIHNGARFTPISIPDSSFGSIPFERLQESTLQLNTSQEVQIGMLPEQLTGMRLPTENGQSILITTPGQGATTTNGQKVQHIVVRDSIKQEYFVENQTTEIVTTSGSSIISGNSDHIRSQRTGRKCRKVYGVNNRHEWCTACRWKKACRRFPS